MASSVNLLFPYAIWNKSVVCGKKEQMWFKKAKALHDGGGQHHRAILIQAADSNVNISRWCNHEFIKKNVICYESGNGLLQVSNFQFVFTVFSKNIGKARSALFFAMYFFMDIFFFKDEYDLNEMIECNLDLFNMALFVWTWPFFKWSKDIGRDWLAFLLLRFELLLLTHLINLKSWVNPVKIVFFLLKIINQFKYYRTAVRAKRAILKKKISDTVITRYI